MELASELLAIEHSLEEFKLRSDDDDITLLRGLLRSRFAIGASRLGEDSDKEILLSELETESELLLLLQILFLFLVFFFGAQRIGFGKNSSLA